MSASNLLPRTAAGGTSLATVLLERDVWLLFVLGLGTGFPAAAYWLNVFPPAYLEIDRALLLSLTGFGVTGLLGFIAAPFLDRFRSPLFRSLGHRRAWIAFILTAGLVVFALHFGTAAASQAATTRFAVISGVLALVVWALLWIATDALRIELYRGRSQAAAFTVQYFGSLAAWALLSMPVRDWHYLAPAALCAFLFALAFGAIIFIREPSPVSPVDPARAPFLLGTLARPLTSLYAQHGRALGFLLAAFLCYGLAVGGAEYLGEKGYVLEILRANSAIYDADANNAYNAVSAQEIAIAAAGALVGLLIAFRLPPSRAFFVLLYAALGLIGFYVLSKAQLGFSAFTVAGLFALYKLLFAASYVVFATIAARLTRRPDTAGQYALLSLSVSLLSLSTEGFSQLAMLIGGYAVASGSAAAAITAIFLMRSAARAARGVRRTGN